MAATHMAWINRRAVAGSCMLKTMKPKVQTPEAWQDEPMHLHALTHLRTTPGLAPASGSGRGRQS